jgi:hypothetical protein
MALDLNKFRGDAAQEAEYGFRSFAWQNQRVRGGEGQKDRPAADWWLWRRKLDELQTQLALRRRPVPFLA